MPLLFCRGWKHAVLPSPPSFHPYPKGWVVGGETVCFLLRVQCNGPPPLSTLNNINDFSSRTLVTALLIFGTYTKRTLCSTTAAALCGAFFLHICTAGHVFLMHSYDAGYGKFGNKPSLFVRLVVTHPPRNIHLKLRSGVKIFRSDRPPGFAHYQVPIDFFKPTTRHWYGDVPARWSVYCAIFQGLFWKEKGCEYKCVHIWHLISFQLVEGLHSSLNPFFLYLYFVP